MSKRIHQTIDLIDLINTRLVKVIAINLTRSFYCVLFDITEKNIVISPNFMVWKFCGKAQFPHSFERFTLNYAETVSFYKISTPEN